MYDVSPSFSDAPRVELALGASISPDSIYEGGDVYFDCKIKALPPPKKIQWQFDVSERLLDLVWMKLFQDTTHFDGSISIERSIF